jgi:nitrite reductase/ring-hydroxylating ferredoxin subunit
VTDGPRAVVAPGGTLCRLSDLEDPGSKEFRIATAKGPRSMFVVRKGDAVYGYLNRCPHTGVTLEWKDDTFLDYDKALIQCSMHGARFVIETGECISGPCWQARLAGIGLALDGDRVIYTG